MKTDSSFDLADRRVREWFLREGGHCEREEANPPHVKHGIITISRQFGAGGHTIAEELVKHLGAEWEVWDKEIIEAVAESAQVRTRMVEALDERTQSWLEYTLSGLSGGRTLAPSSYRRHLETVLLAISHQGNKIIMGRGANFVLTDGLHVRLRASIETRRRETMRRENILHDAAVSRVAEVDDQRAAFISTLFNRDVENPSGYHMVLQTDTLGHAATVAAIVAAIRSKCNPLRHEAVVPRAELSISH